MKHEEKENNENIHKNDKSQHLLENRERSDSTEGTNSPKYMLTYFFYIALAMILVVLLIILITIFTDKQLSLKDVYSRSDDKIIKPSFDFRKYRHLVLKNGLEAVLISDPVTVTAGASLCVKAGANNDPNNIYGLAHFTEHMLFLGSKKYPDGDDYFKTITENNGNFNAYTDREITNYFFDIHYSAFDKAIDVFSRFFIDPLFHKEKVDKEVNAVNSEYEKNLILDSRKRSQIFASLAKADNPYNRFTTGNFDTLVKNPAKNAVDIREELIKFHNRYYVSDKMKLVLYSNKDLDEMEELAVLKFSEIKPTEDFDIVTDRLKKKKEYFLNTAPKHKNDQTKQNNRGNNIKSTGNSGANPKSVASNFVNPFDQEVLGSIVKFQSISMEHEMEINFIQPPSYKNRSLFDSNPYYFFYNVFVSKEENSLYFNLKKEELITKISVESNKQYNEWSEFSLSITLTKKGAKKLDYVLQILYNFIQKIKLELINKDTHSYLKTLAKLHFEYHTPYTHKIINAISDIAKKSQSFPIQYILYDNNFNNNFESSLDYLKEFIENLDLEKSLIFIPSKGNEESFNKLLSSKSDAGDSNNSKNTFNTTFITPGSEKNNYDPWYKTNFTIYKINWEHIKQANISASKSNLSNGMNQIVKSFDENLMNQLISHVYTCDSSCIERLKTVSFSEPILISKTNTSQFWYKQETTLNFKEIAINILFNFEKFEKIEEKIYIILLKSLINKKLRQIKQKLKFLSKSLHVKENKKGIEIFYTSFDENVNKITAEISEQLKFITGFDNWIDDSDFEVIKHDTHEELLIKYNSQPNVLAYEYAKRSALTNYTTSEEYLFYLKKVKLDSFIKFVERFSEEFTTKILIIGDIEKEKAKEIYQEMNPILRQYWTAVTKIPTIREKKLMRVPIIKNGEGNYLLKVIYHQASNKNNVLLKCYKIGKNNYKNEVMVNLFYGVLGNIIFQELRAKRQFGYVAKSRIELFDNYYFFCIHVQGSYQLPHVIDDAALDIVDNLIKEKIKILSEIDFKEAKRRNLDTLSSSRLILSSVTDRFFNSIIENNYDFPTFKKMEKFSASIKKENLMHFYEENFKSQNHIFTVYMYAQKVSKDDMNIKSEKVTYKEVNLDELKTIQEDLSRTLKNK